MSGEPVERLLRLRRRLTFMLASVAAAGLGVLALVAILVDARLRAGEADAYRQGLASRSAALVFPSDETGDWVFEGVIDDVAHQAADAVVVGTRSGEVLYVSNSNVSGFDDIFDAGIADMEEVGVQGTVLIDDAEVAAAAAPFWDFDTTEGVVIIALADTTGAEQGRLRLLVASTAIGLTALAAAAAWIMAGRVVKPVAEAVDREERFLTTAAHDIRTPLSRVRALADSALRSASQLDTKPDTRQLRSELQRLVAAATEASDGANDLLLAGRIDADQLEVRRTPVRLELLVAKFESSVPGLAVETFGPITVYADEVLLRHAVANVLANATKHGRQAHSDALIEASVTTDNSGAVIRVADNGPGLGQVDPDRLFDRYNHSGSSSGLGLWIVDTIVADYHGGTVSIANRYEAPGTVVTITLPITPISTDS